MSTAKSLCKSHLVKRHCEPTGLAKGQPEDRLREAIQSPKLRQSGLPSRCAPRNDGLLKGSYKIVLLAFFIVLIGLAAAPLTRAADTEPAEPSLEGLYYDWSLYGMEEGGNRVCYLSSGLERSSEPVPRRRPAYVLIANRPAEGKKGIVSVDPGYVYDDGSTVLMTVGRRQFHLFTKGGGAWAEDGDDLQIIAAIRSGSTLVVTGRMKNGPATTDTFSLKGFGPALAALDRACPVSGAAQATAPAKAKKRRTAR